MTLFARILQDKAGAALVEFALLTSLLFTAFLPVLDFGQYLVNTHKLGQGVSASAMDAFKDRASVDFASIPAYVRSASDAPGTATVTVACNGSSTAGACVNTGRTCACLANTGTYTPATCAAICTGTGMSTGQRAGYYLTISASYPYSSMIVPRRLFNNGAISKSVTVRLQ